MQTTLTLSSKIDKKTQKSEIFIRFSGGRNIRLRAKSGIYVKQDYWDYEHGDIRVASRKISKNEQKIVTKTKEKLDGLCNYIKDRFSNREVEVVDKDWLEKTVMEFMRPETRPVSNIDLFDAFDMFIDYEGQIIKQPGVVWSPATKKKFKTIKTHLEQFDANLKFDDLDIEKLSEFITFEQNTLELLDSTVKRHLVYLKWFLHWAVNMNFTHNTDFEKFTTGIPNQKTKVIYLTEKELEDVIAHDYSKNWAMDRVRDVYLFCCFTGLRYSDVYNLNWSNISDDYTITFTTQKTKDELYIPITSQKPREIIDKYRHCHFRDNKVLPVISNQKMNDALKIMAKDCGITSYVEIIHYKKGERVVERIPKYELITTHTARKTFVCTAIRLEINPAVIMEITGHKSYATMKPYIDAEDKVKKNAMKKFDLIGK